jgi:UDP-N-acetylglucosamine 1-carboxyvinyltransferase
MLKSPPMTNPKDVVRVIGGNPLKGTVTPIPNKNFLVNLLPAALLTDEDFILNNVPATSDIEKILSMLEKMGASVERTPGTVKINCKDVNTYRTDAEIGGKFRSSISFAGPLLARFGKAEVCVPGGCVLGKRSIAAHIDVFQKCGVTVDFIDGYVVLTAPKKLEKQYNIWQLEASVTATANFAMYAAGTESEFSLTGAAAEPHINDVLQVLNDMGAEVTGAGSNKVKVKGSAKLHGVTAAPGPDHVDIAGYIVAAAVTKGEIRISGANIPYVVDGILEWFTRFNIDIKRDGEDLVVSGKNELFVDCANSGFPLAEDDLPKLYPRPWPGFPVDVLPIMPVLASKTRGKMLIQNWMYETGLDFVSILKTLGANIFRSDPQKVIVYGPTEYIGGIVMSPNIIQAAKALFLASLCDPVETAIYNVSILRRRYPDIFEVYAGLGADIRVG